MNATHLKRIAKKLEKRPILQCVNYDGEHAVFTNSYFLVREKLNKSVEKAFNINMRTMNFYEGTYPEVKSIYPPREKLIKVESIELVVKYDGAHYIVKGQGHEMVFAKNVVDDAFGCMELKVFSPLVLPRLYLTNETFPKMIYDDEVRLYALILGMRKKKKNE